MIKVFCLLVVLTAGKYFICDQKGHACKVGTTCCPRSGGEFGCCPLENGVCCADSDGHCCPKGYPICDTIHKKCSNHLSLSQPILVKTEALAVKNATEFFVGLAVGLGVRLDQYANCTQELVIAFSLLQQALVYMQGETSLDDYIFFLKLGESFEHFSLGGFNCKGAFQSSVNFVSIFFKSSQTQTEMFWQILKNISGNGNYMLRELNGITKADWTLRGTKVGHILTYLLRVS